MIVKNNMFTIHPDNPPESKTRQAIGYWKPITASGNEDAIFQEFFQELKIFQKEKYDYLPDPKDFIDVSWSFQEKVMVSEYIRNQPNLVQWRGSSNCRLCGKSNGSTCKGDDIYIFPSGFAHYVEEHDVKPPRTFIDHVKRKNHMR